jgi:chorismate synthase
MPRRYTSPAAAFRRMQASSPSRSRLRPALARRGVDTLGAVDMELVTSGQSHGPGIVAVVRGLPAGLAVDRERMQRDLARRQAGYGRSPRQKLERDEAEILGGMRHGRTLGGPLALIVRNRDHANWGAAMSAWPVTDEELADVAARRTRRVVVPRPGHADLAGALKYELDDVRDVLERASARETCARVAVGAIAKDLLDLLGIAVHGHVVRIGGVAAPLAAEPGPAELARAAESEVGCADPAVEAAMIAEIDDARKAQDTLGGVVEVRAFGCPPGLGSHTEPRLRLDARLAAAALGIPAMKGVEIGDGFANAALRGSQVHDEIAFHDGSYRRATNRAGGIEGGMTNGETVVVRVAMKPLPTLMKPLATATLDTHEPATALVERSDTTAVAAAAVVAEAVVAFELARCVREKHGGDAVGDLVAAHRAYLARIPWTP